MADALVSSVLNKLDSLISEQVGVVYNAKGQLEKLKSELQAVRATISAADGLPYFMVEGMKDWLQNLKEVAYDAEDVIDEYHARIAISEKQGDTRMTKVRRLLTSFPLALNKPVKLYHELGKEVQAINERLAQIVKERERYKFDGFARQIQEVKTNRKTNYLLGTGIVGRESDKEALVEKLMLDNESSVSILSIVGIGGVGKTTLAKMAFNDERVKKHFGNSAMWWVFISQRPSSEDVSKKILEAVRKEAINISEMNTVCELLRPVLSKQKFLLVLDDVWDLDWWEQLKALFCDSVPGSKILITTRAASISLDMRAVYMHELETFTFKESWDLFIQRALRDGETEEVLERQNLKDIANDIVNKCGGLPLVVQTVGSVMYSKERKRQSWKIIKDSKIWDWKLPQGSSLLPGLILSYDDLPSILKPYFSFFIGCGKRCHVERDYVVAQAMAHGLVKDTDEADMEEIALDQINELLGRSLLQVRETQEKLHCLAMHDILHDLATYVAGREYSMGHTSVGEHTRRLAIGDCIVSLDELGLQSTKSLRTLICHGGLLESPMEENFNNLKRLRVLDFSFSKFSKLPKCVGDLILLKILMLAGSNIEELPASIGRLYHLQTLSLYGSKIKKLPKEIGELCNLRHVDLRNTYKLEFVPEGLGRLSLRYLPRFLICDGTGGDAAGSSIRELKTLNKLHRKIAIEYLERVREKNDARNAKLQEKILIEELELAYGRVMVDAVSTQEEATKVAEAHESLFEQLLLPPNLNHLIVTQYCGRLFPANWCSFDNQMRLQSFKLQCCPCIEMLPKSSTLTYLHLLKCHHLRELPSLPSLFELEIDQCDRLNQLPIFSKLKTLKLENLLNWEGWQHMEEWAMGHLTTMRVRKCPKLRELPRFPLLKQLDVIECKSLCTIQDVQGDAKLEMIALTDLVVCDCEELRELPSMPALKTLKIKACHKIKQVPLLKELEKLDVRDCLNWEGWTIGLIEENLMSLQELQIRFCPMLRSLPCVPALKTMVIRSCGELNALWDEKEPPVGLEGLYLYDCPQLGFSFDSLLPLTKLYGLGFSWSPIWNEAKPPHLAYLERLSKLILTMRGQNPLPEWLWHLSNLKWLSLQYITEATRLQGKWQNLKQLETLVINECPELIALEGPLTEPQKQGNEVPHQQKTQFSIPPKLEQLAIRNCPKLSSLPSWLHHIQHLKCLRLLGLPELTSLPQEICNLQELEGLVIRDCPKISAILPMELKRRLGRWRLIIKGCPALEEDS